MPRTANGIHIPQKSDNTPHKKRRTVPPPSCIVKIYPNVFPSTFLSVFSDTKENNAGKVIKVETPSRTIISNKRAMFVTMARAKPIKPVKRYPNIKVFFLPRNIWIFSYSKQIITPIPIQTDTIAPIVDNGNVVFSSSSRGR